MTTIELDGTIIAAVRQSLSGLASRASTQAESAAGNTPFDCGLPGPDIPKAVEWIQDQDSELQYVEDLAFLLEESGKASFEAPSGQISDLRDAMIDRLSEEMSNLDDMDNPGDREEMERIAEIMGHYTQDEVVSTGLIENLGPQGLSVAIQHMSHWVGDDSMPNYLGPDAFPDDPVAERERIEELQDALATNLAAMLGTASRQPGFDPDFGRELVEQGDAWSVSVIMDYGDEPANYPGFGKDFLVSSGEAMLEREHQWGGNGSWSWADVTGAPNVRPFGTDHSDDAAMNDPVLQWMQVLDDNPDASQEIMLDEDRMKYLLGERKSEHEDTDGAAAGNVLRAATVDQATGYDPRYDEAGGIEDTRARNASIISANVLDNFGGDAEPLSGVDEEIGGIVATYIADVDRTAQSRSGQDGDIYENGELLPEWLQDGEGGTRGMPAYGIKMNYDDLRGVLQDVGDNDTAKSIIGSASTNYNQARMNHYADVALDGGHVDPDRVEIGSDDPLMGSVNSSAQLNGFLTDALVTGDIGSEEERAEARRGVAEFFTMPLDAIPTGKTGPVGGFIVGEVKDQIIDGYVGDGVQDAITDGETSFNETAVSTRLQALHTVVTHEGSGADGAPTTFPVGDLRDDWPRDDHGDFVSPGSLTDDQVAAILNASENGDGYSGAVGREVDTAVGTLMQNYGDK